MEEETATIADYTETSIENLVLEVGIEETHEDDFTCLKYQTMHDEDEDEEVATPEQPHHNCQQDFCLRNSRPKNKKKKKSKCVVRHQKFFDRITGLFLGNSRTEAARRCLKNAFAAFESENYAEASRLFAAAHRGLESGSDDSDSSQNMLEISQAVVEAMNDLGEENFDGFVTKMQEARRSCNNASVSIHIANKLAQQADVFSAKSRQYSAERKYRQAGVMDDLSLKAMCWD